MKAYIYMYIYINGKVVPGLVSIQLLWNPYGCCPQESGAHRGYHHVFLNPDLGEDCGRLWAPAAWCEVKLVGCLCLLGGCLFGIFLYLPTWNAEFLGGWWMRSND